jgi:DNA-binding NarL/FixJ family response regulator
MNVMNWIKENYEWLLGSGGIVSLITLVYNVFKKKKSSKIENNVTINNNIENDNHIKGKAHCTKESIQVLFIDDEKFKIVENLKKAGYVNTKTIKDVANLDSPDVKNADVIFVDINGVGKFLFPQDEGLGLAEALKNKYKDKYIGIYSAQEQGNRFHKALKAVDFTLSKNAEPYEFITIIDNYCNEDID